PPGRDPVLPDRRHHRAACVPASRGAGRGPGAPDRHGVVRRPDNRVEVVSVLYDIPVIGLVFQLIDFLVNVVTVNGVVILALAAPIALGGLCGVMNERSGVVNIGIEGTMLASAFVGWFVASVAAQALPSQPGPVFGATPGLIVGLVAAILAGMVVSLVHAWLCISVRANQIISGTIINIVAIGLTGYFALLISTNPMPTAGKV